MIDEPPSSGTPGETTGGNNRGYVSQYTIQTWLPQIAANGGVTTTQEELPRRHIPCLGNIPDSLR